MHIVVDKNVTLIITEVLFFMLGLLIAIVVVAWVARFVLKKYPAQPVLFTAGIVMMVLTLVLGLGEILPAKQSTG